MLLDDNRRSECYALFFFLFQKEDFLLLTAKKLLLWDCVQSVIGIINPHIICGTGTFEQTWLKLWYIIEGKFLKYACRIILEFCAKKGSFLKWVTGVTSSAPPFAQCTALPAKIIESHPVIWDLD